MNRVLYLLSILIIFSGKATAQQIIWSDNLNYHYSSGFAAPWGMQGNAGSSLWACDIDYYIGGLCFPPTDNNTRVAGIRSEYACYPHHSDSSVILITPPIDLTNYTAAAFQYDTYFTGHVTNGLPETAHIEVSTDSGHTWTTLRNAPIAYEHKYETQFVNLNAYAGSTIRMGFRYSDNGRDSMVGWMVDNFKAFVPVAHDMAFIPANPADSLLGFAIVGDSVAVSGKVMNMGSNPVSSYTISYRLDNGTVFKDSISGITLAPFDTASFQLSRRAGMSSAGRHIVSMWVVAAGDTNPANDSSKVIVYGAAFIPNKLTVLEAGTGTWYPFAPQQYVLLHNLSISDYPLASIAMHDQDPMMEDVPYRDYILHLRQSNVPFFLFDRQDDIVADRYVIVTDPPPTRIFALFTDRDLGIQLERNSKRFAFADITAQPDLSAGNTLQVHVGIKPAINLSGNYRLALVLTEDSVHGTTSGYDQQNYFFNNYFGPMDGYENKPNPVPGSSMFYNSIAHSVTPAADGTGAILPATMLANNTYTNTLYAPFRSTYTLRHLHAIVLLLNGTDGTILNAVNVPIFPLAVNHPVGNNDIAVAVYPNPATTSADLLFNLQKQEAVVITVTDLTGKVLLTKAITLEASQQIVPVRTDEWAAGMYLINVRIGNAEKTLKLSVLP